MPWRLLTRAGHEVVFATEKGAAAPQADPLLLTGVLFGQLGAEPEPSAFYRELERDAAFCNPVAWDAIDVARFDGLLLAGGHAPGMRQYLGSTRCRSRSRRSSRRDGRSARSATACWWRRAASIPRPGGASSSSAARPACQGPWSATAYWLTAWKLGRYYRTYPAYVEDEVRAALRDPARQFERGPIALVRRDRRRIRARPSSSRTAATCRRAGPATRMPSRAPSSDSWGRREPARRRRRTPLLHRVRTLGTAGRPGGRAVPRQRDRSPGRRLVLHRRPPADRHRDARPLVPPQRDDPVCQRERKALRDGAPCADQALGAGRRPRSARATPDRRPALRGSRRAARGSGRGRCRGARLPAQVRRHRGAERARALRCGATGDDHAELWTWRIDPPEPQS